MKNSNFIYNPIREKERNNVSEESDEILYTTYTTVSPLRRCYPPTHFVTLLSECAMKRMLQLILWRKFLFVMG
jgi:hypothetical protein